MDARTHGPDCGETSHTARMRYGIDAALADIKRLHEELQSQELQRQGLLSQELRRRRPPWQPFALGFGIGAVFFAAAIAGVRFLG